MDIISHGLWGGLVFGRKNKRLYWLSFLFGIMPDLFSFGIFTVASVLGIVARPDWGHGTPDAHTIPQFVDTLYNVTHSLLVFSIIFGLIWLLRKKPFLPMLAWGLHVLVDIPTHSFAFFPTPFLWPVSDFMIDGISWGRTIIFYPDVIFLVLGYFVWWARKRKKKVF